MAEIKIKKKSPIWPWVLLVLLILGLTWYFFTRDDDTGVIDNESFTPVDTVAYENRNMNSSLDFYSSLIADSAKMGIDHEYSNEALNHLIDAVDEKATMENVDLEADLEEARTKTTEITKDPSSLNHADLIKSTGKIIARALNTLQTSKFPNLSEEMAKVNSSVDEIDTNVQTLDQKDKVNNFFRSTESLLSKMQ